MTVLTYGRYELREKLGAGGLGQVYAGVDMRLNRPVAVKILKPELADDEGLLARFYEEASSLSRLHHANITTLFSLEDDPKPFMVMELVQGETIENIMRRKRLWVLEALALMPQICAGLGYAHAQGIIHRDIKPANLMVTPAGEVKLMDFGIARVRGSKRLTESGKMIGTPAYMSPEQVRGQEGDERSDIYSLGILLYELLSGRVPFDSDSDFDIKRAHLEAAPPRLGDKVQNLPMHVEAALLRALAKQPEQRFASAEAFAAALGLEHIQAKAPGMLRAMLAQTGLTAPEPLLDSTAPGFAGTTKTGPRTTTPRARKTPPPGTMLQGAGTAKRAAITLQHLSAAAPPLPVLALSASVLVCLVVLAVLWLHHPAPQTVHLSPTPPVQTGSGSRAPSTSSTARTGQGSPIDLPPVKPDTLTPRAAISGQISQVTSPVGIWVDGQPLNLAWVAMPSMTLADQQKYQDLAIDVANKNGGQVTCQPVGTIDYQCMINGNDLAALILQNGLAEVSRATPADGAPPASYDAAQQAAQAHHLNLFASPNVTQPTE
jgi:serine/threonine-protein kinase